MPNKPIGPAEFVTSFARYGDYADMGTPEVAMVGRSNVGKSSLINCLAGRRKLARISSEPGKTRLINIYRLPECPVLVDLPGYGFAKAPKNERVTWQKMIEGYFHNSMLLFHALQLVDIRHEPTADDMRMVSWLRHIGIQFTVVATKADKLSRAQIGRSVPVICRTLGVQPWEVMTVSSDTGAGRDDLLRALRGLLPARDEADG